MRSCHELSEDPDVRCIICFATAAQIRDLCALAHFRRYDVFAAISVPWGPIFQKIMDLFYYKIVRKKHNPLL
jgi:hypothetical protein